MRWKLSDQAFEKEQNLAQCANTAYITSEGFNLYAMRNMWENFCERQNLAQCTNTAYITGEANEQYLKFLCESAELS